MFTKSFLKESLVPLLVLFATMTLQAIVFVFIVSRVMHV